MTSSGFVGHLCTTQGARAVKQLQVSNQSRKLVQSKLGSLVTQLKYLRADIKLACKDFSGLTACSAVCSVAAF